ncbi:enhancer of rudimentary erh [Anaeramoeba flamelloides]|uniref:Enhancer of rudimentary erh n=1 Tax=Anaeramoeba flamelloides TaxID=1746091 RepID=A0AAV7YCM2_9EUKA|nr:enhancer of rudimentary erh [Anaeramoeba flamelloides]KAJ6236863.1 enhancer of rudimentary erh [Anaeramoeba flamelloides]
MSKREKHTILLLQISENRGSRTYYDYPTVTAAMNGICSIFEQKLREHTKNRNVEYDTEDINYFLENITDISCLVLDFKTNQYSPRSRNWIKERLKKHLINISRRNEKY